MTATVDQANWSPLQELAPADTTTATIGSYVVPWTYGDFEEEYRTLRSTAAKIDLSAARLIEVTGEAAYDLLQYALARDLEFVTPEQSLISLVLDAEARPVDIVNVYTFDEGYRLETAVGRAPATLAHLEAIRAELGFDAALTVRDDLAIILVEGPQAATVLEETVEPDLGSVPLSGLIEVEFADAQVLVSRTGFTGEYGYKLIVATTDAGAVWKGLDAAVPVGHQALEIAMLEVRQPVLQRELGDSPSAIEAGYSWLADITKEEFHGREALIASFDEGVRVNAIGFAVESTGATEPVPVGTTAVIEGEEIGTVLHSAYSPGKESVIGLLRIRKDLVAPSLGFELDGAAAVTLGAPYVIPESWKVR